MTTPKRQDVIDRAFSIYQKRNRNVSSITPELEEVKEDGTYEQARNSLMRSKDAEYKAYVEQQARELGLIKDDLEYLPIQPFSVDILEAMKTGTFITGTRQCGKTTLVKHAVQKMINERILVYVVDPTCQYFNLGLPIVVCPQPYGRKVSVQFREESTVFDTSQMSPHWQQDFIENFNRVIMETAIKRGKAMQPKTMIVYEEAHTSMPNYTLNSKAYRETKRLITQGANFNISFMAITQFSSMIDKLPVKCAQQRYFGRTSEPNDLRYLKAYLGEKVNLLPKLETGQFLYSHKGTTTKIQTELYRDLEQKQNLIYAYNYSWSSERSNK